MHQLELSLLVRSLNWLVIYISIKGFSILLTEIIMADSPDAGSGFDEAAAAAMFADLMHGNVPSGF